MTVLWIRIWDPVLFYPGVWEKKIQDLGSVIRGGKNPDLGSGIQNKHHRLYFYELKVRFFDKIY